MKKIPEANDPIAARLRMLDVRRLLIRGQRVWLDSHLAEVFNVTTSELRRQFKRHRARFPFGFAFQLMHREVLALRSQEEGAAIQYAASLPWAFTESGTLILAGVLKSPVAVEISVRLVRAFVRMQNLTARATAFGQVEGFGESRIR